MKWTNTNDWINNKTNVMLKTFGVRPEDTGLDEDMEEVAQLKNRNFHRIPMKNVREEIDSLFNRLHDSLEVTYYQYWKKGLNKEFLGIPKPLTAKGAKDLFDTIHGVLWKLYTVAKHKKNMSLPIEDRTSILRYDSIYSEEGEYVGSKSIKAKEYLSTAPQGVKTALIAELSSVILEEDLAL